MAAKITSFQTGILSVLFDKVSNSPTGKTTA
jgi:hypothetical protein